ncbi:MAG: hypothetical protein RLY70_4023 [Planctomycetota bacterium]
MSQCTSMRVIALTTTYDDDGIGSKQPMTIREYGATVERSQPRWAILAALALLLVAIGCGDNTKYLPKPRPPKPNAGKPNNAAPADSPPVNPVANEPSREVNGDLPAVTAAAPTPASAMSSPVPSATTARTGANAGYQPVDPAALQLEVEEPKNKQSVTAEEYRRLSSIRMRKIAAAMATYAAEKKSFPPSASRDVEENKCLSWRVLLLPYLGHSQLYAMFNLKEPWHSPRNKALLASIPPVFQSPSRTDTRTNYLLVSSEASAFPPGAMAGVGLAAITDGFANTASMVEVDDDYAVEWTSPGDYYPAANEPLHGLEKLHADGFLLGWADGSVSLWPRSAPANLIPGLFTIAGGEPPGRSYGQPAWEDKLVGSGGVANAKDAVSAAAASGGKAMVDGQPDVSGTRPMTATAKLSDKRPGPGGGDSGVDIRREPPSEEQLEQASTIVRDLYSQEFKNAKLDKDKRDFAKKLIEDVERIEADSAGRFVLLRAARDIAAKAGDVTVAIDACDRLGREYRVDILSMKLKALEQAVVNLAAETELAPLYDNSLQLGDEALQLDDFKAAQSLYKIAMNAARRGRSAEREYQMNLRENDLRETRIAYQRITDHVHTLVRAPEDPAANAAVGRYYLLIKRDWDRGLPMVARGDNAELRKLAAADLAQPTEAEALVAVGDHWWDFAEKLSVDTERASARIRARHWYEAAQPSLGASLQKIRVEKRVAEIKREQDKADGKLPATPGRRG